MKYHLANKFLLALLIWVMLPLAAYTQVPTKPVPPRLVNDLAAIFTTSEANQLEDRLVKFSDSTSNQVTIVTLPSLNGYDKAQMAFSIGSNWGVGGAKFNNGVVILVKPRSGNEKGEAFIATGYGLEGALPDAICKRVVEYEMIPHFKDNNYYAGLDAALNVLLPIAAGEYSYQDYKKGEEGSSIGAFIVLFLVFIFVMALVGKKGGGPTNIGGGNRKGPSALDLLLLGSILSSGGRGRSSGGLGGGSFGGGGFGGGGFGGFGGGGFGGGGAGGSW